MKKVFIIHGWDGSPDEPMLRGIRRKLEEKGITAIAPEMPSPEFPDIEAWNEKLKRLIKKPDNETYFIGHSIGCQAILRYSENLPEKIIFGGAILIAPWLHLRPESIQSKEDMDVARPWIETPINLNKIKKHFKKIICIFSNNDPFVPLSDAKIFEEKLNSEIIVERNKGHYDPESVRECPTALNKLIEVLG